MPAPLEMPPEALPAWDVSLLGTVTAQRGSLTVTHFGSRAAAALLARLAMYPQRQHPREELIEHLWPGVALEVGRNRLRQTLFMLRQRLEPPRGPAALPVITADHHGLRVLPGALHCDVQRFEAAWRAGRHAQAQALYRGELMPGHYDGWIEEERLRLAALFDRVVQAAEAALPPPSQASRKSASLPAAPLHRLPGELTRPEIPTYLTRFFGREAELAGLHAQVRSHRLVTLLGAGGSGKTRLAVELAHSLAPARTDEAAQPFDQVIFAPLVTCHSEAQLLDALLAHAHLDAQAGESLKALTMGLAGRRLLMVLDNVEQLGGAMQTVALHLLHALPQLHLLATSRHVLGVDGEREFNLAPLALPQADSALEQLAANASVAMFIDRARAVRPAFHIDAGNRESLVTLVRELEGLPLALELAASRLRSLSCGDMLALLRAGAAERVASPRLELLARDGPRARTDSRHASMRRVVEWSWNQLAPEPAQLLCALTVFQGGFTPAAVLAVCTDAAGFAADHALHGSGVALRLLDELVSHSLVHVSEGEGLADAPKDSGAGRRDHRPVAPAERRLGLYEPIREFCTVRLAAVDAHRLRARHRAWLIGWGETLGHRLPLSAFRTEMPNVLAALASALQDGAPADALRLALALRARLEDSALPAHAIALLEAALQQTDDPVLTSRAHSLLGKLCLDAGLGDAARRHVDAGLASVPPDAALRARALQAHASVHWRGKREAQTIEAQLDEAEALARQCGDLDIEASVHALRAYVCNVAHRDFANGRALHERALDLWARAGHDKAVSRARYSLAVSDHHLRRYGEALERLDDVISQARMEQNWQQLGKAMNLRGLCLHALRRWPDAWVAYQDCVRMAWQAGQHYELAYGFWNLPRTLARMRRPDAAAQLSGFAASFWQTRIGSLSAADHRDLRRDRRLVAVQLGQAVAKAQRQRGERLSLPEAVSLACDATDPL